MKVFKNDCLVGKSFLVTGASSGIGRATARLIAECGGRVLINGRDIDRLNETLDKLPGVGHKIYPMVLENADQAFEWARSVIDADGPLSGLFHCAGVEFVLPVKLMKQDKINLAMGGSVFAGFGIAKAIARKSSIVDGASLVFMSSVAASTGQMGLTAYGAAKAAVEGLVRSLACELAPRRIRVNAVAAGAVHTSMLDRRQIGSGQEAMEAFERNHLLGFGQANDVADAVLFLLSDASRWITGSSMVVDGGYMVR